MNILIADDTATDRLVLTSYLRQLGHEVTGVGDGEQAVDTFRHQRHGFDLLILDVIMPRLNGYEAARQMRIMMGEEWIPIIFLSGQTEAEDLVAGIESGGDDYLFKPINKSVLTAKMNAMHRISLLRQKLSESNRRMERLVHIDGLTGVSNRRYLDTVLEREFLRCRRSSLPLSLLMIDVDHFKQFNDRYGHIAGDECLKMIASAINETVRRPADLVARYGGEEFCVVLPETDLPAAQHLAETIRHTVESRDLLLETSHDPASVEVSIGVAMKIPGGKDTVKELLDAADKALYRAKEEGRNRVCYAENL